MNAKIYKKTIIINDNLYKQNVNLVLISKPSQI